MSDETSRGFIFKGIKPLQEMNENAPYVLVISHVDKTPPHIGLIINGLYYSLTINGPENGINANQKKRHLKIKRIPTLFLTIFAPSYTPEHHEISAIFNFSASLSDGATCLEPVNKIFSKYWNIEITKPLLFGLLESLEVNKLIDLCYYHELNSGLIVKQTFTIRSYRLNDVRSYIKSLTLQKN